MRTTAKLSAGAVFLACVTVVCAHGLASSEAAAASTLSGASQAICAPAPCAPADSVTYYELANVENGDGTTSTREYGVYRPQHLTPSPGNLAPAVLVFYQSGDCGLQASGRFASLATDEHFIVVYMEVPCAREAHNWDKRNIDPETSTAVNDEPYVTAVVRAITQCPSSQAESNQCVDPQRIYAAGTSSGGNMAADVMCDVENSPSFRGYLIDSSSLQLFGGEPGEPACPSSNRDFFVMMALSNYGIDAGLYDNTAHNRHLDVPAFADWAAARLECKGRRLDDAIGYPTASTLRYTYLGPCGYAEAGSPAVVTLGVQNGEHTWTCQDSDAGAPPNACFWMSNPPGLTSRGLPNTNGLFVEECFWNLVARDVSQCISAPALESPPVEVTIPPGPAPPVQPASPAPPARAMSRFVALGDGYSAGGGNSPFLPGTDTAHDRCRRSTVSYPYMAAALAGKTPALVFRACSGATIGDFYRPNRRDREPAQLSWLGGATRLVSVSAGWSDSLLAQALRSCAQDSFSCRAQWHIRVQAAIAALGAHSAGSRKSLYALYRRIGSLAPAAQAVVVGYPRLFTSHPPQSCATTGRSRTFTRGAMEWIDSEILRLDRASESAAALAHIGYLRNSYAAFAGHELCTRHPDLTAASPSAAGGADRSGANLAAGFSPDRHGENVLAGLLEGSL
jgi:hypothetical protein